MELSTPTSSTLESPASVLLVHNERTPPGDRWKGDDADGDGDVDADGDGDVDASGERAELTVAFPDQFPGERAGGDEPAKRAIVAVGDVLRAADDRLSDRPSTLAVDAIADPTDLPAIGISVSRFCERWIDVDRIVVSVLSLDRLLRHASPEHVFRFVHALVARLERVGATVRVYFDRSRYDDHLVATFGTLFDEVIVEDSRAPLPEASDDDVAANLAAWGRDRTTRGAGRFEETVSEATDEELARRLEG